jgi:hypothetical protein
MDPVARPSLRRPSKWLYLAVSALSVAAIPLGVMLA